MGHASVNIIMDVYAKLTKEAEQKDAAKLSHYMELGLCGDETRAGNLDVEPGT